MQRILVIASLAILAQVGMAQSKMKPMTDGAMDQVTAAGITANVTNSAVNFQGQTQTPNGLVTATGSLGLQAGSTSGTNLGTLSLNGNAQQNLSSLVNINAVNSKINVLLNLNININSTVAKLVQANLNGKY